MNLPEFHMPELPSFNFRGILNWIKSHLIIVIGVVVILAAGIGWLVYSNYQKEQARLEAIANYDWSIQPLTLAQLEGGKYYIKDGDTFYEVAPGLLASTGEATSVPTFADPENRMVMFGKDDERIPTLYKDTQLIFKSSDFNNPNSDGTVSATPVDYYLERFADQGYSIGVCRLANPDGTKYRTAITQTHFYPGCSALQSMKLKEDAELIIDKVNGVPITANNISPAGTITGLAHNMSYTVDAYIGTSPVGGEVVADTHMFTSFELYDLKDYELDASGYAIIKMPEYMWSGYYYINGVGLFRYINGFKAYGISADVDYNTPYFMGKDQAGNLITNPAPTVKDPNAPETVEGEDGTLSADDEDPFTYHYKVTIDNQQKSMNISIDYSEAMTYSDTNGDGKYEVLKASDGVLVPGASTPAAVLVSPSGERFTMTNMGAIADNSAASLNDLKQNQVAQEENSEEAQEETQAPNSLNATIDNPEIGTWTVDITGIYARTFTISTSYTGSSTNMVVKDSGKATNMTVYVPENLADAVFKFTWDDIRYNGTFVVTGPDHKEVVSNERDNDKHYEYPDNVLLEIPGEVDLYVGEAVAGEYKIKITGEALGHVYWNYLDLADGDSTPSEDAEAVEGEEDTGTEDADTEGATETETSDDNSEKKDD